MADKKSVEVADERAGVDAAGLVLVVFAAVVVSGGLIGVAEIISADGARIDSLAQRSEVVRNIGLFLLGVIGLPLAIWRSWIAKQQVDEMIAQGIRTERQLQHADKQLQLNQSSENLGFVEKGGSLLDDDKSSKRTTGVHILEAVLQQTDDDVSAFAAENILYQFIKYHEKREALEYFLACNAMLKRISFWAGRNEADARQLKKQGASNIFLKHAELDNIYFVATTNLEDCDVEKAIFASSDVTLIDCKIEDSLVLKIAANSKNNRFINCDFSAADIVIDIEGSSFEGCYYHADHPPSQATLRLLTEHLEARDGSSEKMLLK